MGLEGKVGGKISKVTAKADILGAILGYLGTYAVINSYEGGNYFTTLINRHINAVKIHNIANIGKTLPSRLSDPNFNPWLIGGLTAGIVGWIGEYLPTVVPWQRGLLAFAKKFGFGAAVATLGAMVVTTASEGSGGSVLDGDHSGTSSSSVSSTGRLSRPTGNFAPPTPYVGSWVRPR